MTQPTPEEIKRVCPEFWTNYEYRDGPLVRMIIRKLAQSRLENEKLQGQLLGLREASDILENASYQSHNGHWDKEGTGGRNCPECIRAIDLREKAKSILNNTDQAAEQAKAKVWNEAVTACDERLSDQCIYTDLSKLLKPEGGE